MKQLALIAVMSLAAAPASAQEGDVEDGFDMLSEGVQLLLRGLMDEMEPALKELQGALQGLDAYHAPEVLPNGDIIIRRKTPQELERLPEDGDEIEI